MSMRTNKWFRVIAVLMAAIMAIGLLPAFAESGAKWTEEVTPDGWVKVVQEGGDTLGYSPDSGVKLIEDDGYAFKDLDKDGELDAYEDWRLTDEERAEDLVGQLDIHQLSGLRSIVPTFSIGTDGKKTLLGAGMPSSEDSELSLEDIMVSLFIRGVLTYVSTAPAEKQVEWNNKLQQIGETEAFGIPMQVSTDPRSAYIGGVSNLALGATFDTEAVKEAINAATKLYRSVGVTEVLSPQVDIATEPRWSRVSGTFGDDPALSRDMANAVTSGYQSTYDADGNDLGWGDDSLTTQMKHWPGDGAGEGGRESHGSTGAYTVYPGDAFSTSLISFVDGAMDIDSITESASGVMTSYSIAYSDDGSLGELVGSAWSEYKISLLRDYGFDGVIGTDGLMPMTMHGVEGLSEFEQTFKMIQAGIDRALWLTYVAELIEQSYPLLCEDIGEEAAENNYREAGRRILKNYFRVGLFENAYADSAQAASIVDDSDAQNAVNELAQSSIVMLKNDDAIKASAGDKLTVYVPYVYTPSSVSVFGEASPASWDLPISYKALNQYFNVITDEPSDPSGEPDASGNATYTQDDIVRASEAELATCDMAIAFISNPSTGSGYDSQTETYIPISLQYGKYRALSDGVREESIAGAIVETRSETPYGIVTTEEQENRSYYGESTVASNIGDMELVLWLNEVMPESCKIVAAITTTNAMVFSEIEPAADAILVNLGVDKQNFLPILSGEFEPSALLPIQMPLNMETVEAQYEDVPRDMECYMDANGNTYDFAFGMNWSGVINDERVAKYAVEPLVEPETQIAQ